MDETATERARGLRAKAVHARQVLRLITDAQTRANIESHIADLEAQALKLETEAPALSPAAMSTTPSEPGTGPEAIAALKATVPEGNVTDAVPAEGEVSTTPSAS